MDTPLWQALCQHVDEKRLSCHTPGHKSGKLIPKSLAERWQSDVFAYDLTEVSKLDSLHRCTGVIAQSQQNVANLHGWPHARYLTGGSTAGLIAGLLALCERQKVIVPRNVHHCIYHGMALANVTPVYLPLAQDELGHATLPNCKDLEKLLNQHPDSTALVLVWPTYYGNASDFNQLIQLAKQHGLTLICDAAHGAHFPFSDSLPNWPEVDVLVTSSHKSLPVLTGASLLLAKDTVAMAKIDTALMMIESSSPSYLAMASLECAYALMAQEGADIIAQALPKIANLRQTINTCDHLHIIEDGNHADPFRLTLATPKLSGHELAQALAQLGYDAECADDASLLLLLPLTGPYPQLAKDLVALNQTLANKADRPKLSRFPPTLPEQVVPLKTAFFGDKVQVPLQQATSAIAGDFLMHYPPGIPYIAPGERFSSDLIANLYQMGYRPHDLVTILKNRSSHA